MADLGWIKKIEINNTGITFAENHYHFNALIHVSSSSGNNSRDTTCVFDELTTYSERKKIAVTLADGLTQCYVEIQEWDVVAEEAWLWVRIPNIVGGDSTNLILYLWYDSSEADNTTYISDLASTPNVFLPAGVFHLNDSDPSIDVNSSTFYEYFSLLSYNIDAGNIVTGKIGSFLNLNGSNEYMERSFSNPIVYKASTVGVATPKLPFTLECIVKTSNIVDTMQAVSVGSGYQFCSIGFVAGKAAIFMNDGSTHSQVSSTTFADGDYHHIVGVFADVDDRRLYVDGNLVATMSSTYSMGVNYDDMSIGRQAGTPYNYYEGIIGEVRFHLSAGFIQKGSTVQNQFAAGTESIIENTITAPTNRLFTTLVSSFGAKLSTNFGTVWGYMGFPPIAITQGHSLCELSSGRLLMGAYKSGANGLVFYSDNVGGSWTSSATPSTNDGLRALIQGNDGTVYGAGPIYATADAGIWESADDGINWTLEITNTNGDTVLSLFEDSDGTIYAGFGFTTGDVYRKPSGGAWGAAGTLSGSPTAVYNFVEIDGITYALGLVNSGNDTTIYKTEDNGVSWTAITTISDFIGMAFYHDSTFDVTYIFGGPRNDIFKSYDLFTTMSLALTTDVTSISDSSSILKASNGKVYTSKFRTTIKHGESTWLHSDRLKTQEYAEASYLTCWDTLFDYGEEDLSIMRDTLDFVLAAKTTDDVYFNILVRPVNYFNFNITGVESTFNRLRFILKCLAELDDNMWFNLKGKTYDDLVMNILGKPITELDFLIFTDRLFGRRLSLFDTINLRDTGIYTAPRTITNLPVVYGNFSNSRIPCTPLDQDGYLYHISDGEIHSIVEVQIDGSPIDFGFTPYTSYKDIDGKGIACLVFDTPQYNSIVSVSCRGRIKETDELIENPSDIIRDLFLNIQGYDIDCLDDVGLDVFYSDCLNEGVKAATYITDTNTLRDFLDELSLNVQAAWIITDGKQSMRLKWLD